MNFQDNQHNFRDIQLRDFFDREIKQKINLGKNGMIRAIIGAYNSKKYRNTSTLYRNLMEKLEKTTLYVKLKWEHELGVNIRG